MPSTATLQNYRSARPDDGRENVVLETIVIFLALIMIISGFSIYVGNAFAENRNTQVNAITQQTMAPATEKPLSLAEI